MTLEQAKRLLRPEELCAIYFPNSKRRKVRDFLIINTRGVQGFSSPCIIWHLPGGRFKGFSLEFDVAVALLNEYPEIDDEFIHSFYEVPKVAHP